MEAEWLKESRRGDVWTKVMVLRLTAWEGGSDVINRKAAKHPGEGDEGIIAVSSCALDQGKIEFLCYSMVHLSNPSHH